MSKMVQWHLALASTAKNLLYHQMADNNNSKLFKTKVCHLQMVEWVCFRDP